MKKHLIIRNFFMAMSAISALLLVYSLFSPKEFGQRPWLVSGMGVFACVGWLALAKLKHEHWKESKAPRV